MSFVTFKKSLLFGCALLIAASLTSEAQESKVTVTMTVDGKTIKDTSYTVKDKEQAAAAAKLLDIALDTEILEGGEYVYKMKMEDGALVEVTTNDQELHGEHQYVYTINKSENSENIVVHVDEDGKKKVVTKEIIVKDDGAGKEKKTEYIILSTDNDSESEEEIKWIEKEGSTIVIIDGESQEELEELIENEKTEKSTKVIEADGKKIIIKTTEKNGETQVEVEVEEKDKKDNNKSRKKKK